jgi:hypothetical protein
MVRLLAHEKGLELGDIDHVLCRSGTALRCCGGRARWPGQEKNSSLAYWSVGVNQVSVTFPSRT